MGNPVSRTNHLSFYDGTFLPRDVTEQNLLNSIHGVDEAYSNETEYRLELTPDQKNVAIVVALVAVVIFSYALSS